MTRTAEPNPPSRKDEDFPKTNTMPEGWVMDELMDVYNPGAVEPTQPAETESSSYVPATGGNGKTQTAKFDANPANDVNLFRQRLDPYPTPGEQHGMYL